MNECVCLYKRDIMVTENFTNYNIFDNISNKPAQQIAYHRMSESSNPNPIASCGVDKSELFFHGVYNPRIPYMSNRDYDAGIISHHNVTNNSDGRLLQKIRNMFCCG